MLPTPPELFPVLDVTGWSVTALEPAGSDEKVWLANSQSQRALFKPNRAHQGSEQGEDWAEKLAAEVAGVLGVPAARIDLATRDGVRGCVSYNVAPADSELQPGAALISDLVGADFDPRDPGARGHTLTNIATALAAYGAPPGFVGPTEMGGFGVFAGYLVLDALIANRDRHSENWAVLRGIVPGEDALAPTYDHASSLGFNLRDTRRAQLLQDPRMFAAFLQKGDAYRFEDGRRVTLVDYAHRALTLAGGLTRAFWRERRIALEPAQLPRLAAGSRQCLTWPVIWLLKYSAPTEGGCSMGKSATLAQSDTHRLRDERALIVAWQHPVTRAIAPIGLLSCMDRRYTFVYLKDAPSVTGFRPLLGFPDFARQYVSEHLFPIFSQRVMSTNRPDYAHYLDLLQLASDASPLRILGRSGGRREGDSLFLVQKPSTESDGFSRAVFFVHGVRHVAGASARIATLSRGDELLLHPEPDNPVNVRALFVTAKDSSRLGYVPDLLLDYVHSLSAVSSPKLTVLQCNNDDSPPNLRLLVECAGYLPAGYVPFSGDEWAPAVPAA